MADILSTLRELRSLEEKRAHGTLSPDEERRFQELQTMVSTRVTRTQPIPIQAPPTAEPQTAVAPAPVPTVVAPAPAAAAPQPPEAEAEPPFVDADLTEEQATQAIALATPAPVSEVTQVEAAPAPEATEIDPLVASPLVDAPAPDATPPPEASADFRPVPMSAAELRQWNASFAPPGGPGAPLPDESGAEPTMVTAPPPLPDEPIVSSPPELPVAAEEPTSVLEPAPSTEWLAPTPVEPPPPIPLEVRSREPAAQDDAPALWVDSETTQVAPAPPHDDGWTTSVSWSEGIPQVDVAPEPTGVMRSPVPLNPPSAANGREKPAEPVPAAEVSTRRDLPIGEAFAPGESRVVVHTLGGLQKRGSLVDAHMNADFIELRLPDGQREMLSTATLKAVFFVVPIGQEVPKPAGDPVTVTLQDGHQLTGLSPDYQVGAVGFFLCPTDQRSRTAKIYIYAAAVKGIA